MFRNVLAVFLALVAGGCFNMALVMVSHAVYPLPPDVDPNDMEAFRAHVEANGMPTGAMLIILAAHAGGSFVSGLVCGLIAGRKWIGAAVALGTLWTLGGLSMLAMIPAPAWFAVADTISYIPAAVIGVQLGGRRNSSAPSEASYPQASSEG